MTLASPAHRITLEVPTHPDRVDATMPVNRHNMDLPTFNDSDDSNSSSNLEDGPWHDMSKYVVLDIPFDNQK